MAEIAQYNQHFITAFEILGSTDDQVVFLYFWDMHCTKVRFEQPEIIRFSFSEIGSLRNMDYRAVKKSAKHLEEIGLISIDKDLCIVNAKKYIALAATFSALKDKERVKEFIDAVNRCDDITLKSFGVNENINAKEIIKGMKGSSTFLQVDPQICRSTHKNVGQPANLYTDLQNRCSTYKIEGQPTKMSVALQNCINIVDEIILEILDVSDLQNCSSTYKFVDGLLQNCRSYLQNCRTENKYIINKENKGASPSVTSLSSGEEIEDNQEKEDNLENVPFSSKAGNSQDSSQEELINPATINMDKYGIDKERERIPFFPAGELERIVNDPEYCIQHPAFIFINILWNDLTILCSQDNYDEEDGVVEVEVSPEGNTLPVRIVDKAIENAYDATMDILNMGYLEYRGVKLPVDKKEFPKRDTQLIIDWEKISGEREEFYRMSLNKLHNITDDPLPEVREVVDQRAENRRNFRFVKELLRMGYDDPEVETESQYYELTPIEAMAFHFLDEFYDPTEEGILEHKPDEPGFVRSGNLRVFYSKLPGNIKEHVTVEDFYGILVNTDKSQRDAVDLSLKPYSCRAVEEWNRRHKYESRIKID